MVEKNHAGTTCWCDCFENLRGKINYSKYKMFLRGLCRTTLVVPRIVVRELDCMLRCVNFFTRRTEVSAALQWIQECMVVAKWWIHVQSSTEEGNLIPPTSHASSPHWFTEDKTGAFFVGSNPFSPYSLQSLHWPQITSWNVLFSIKESGTMDNLSTLLTTLL